MKLRDVAAATVWGAACVVAASLLAVAPAWSSAFAGGFGGYFAGAALARTRLRTPVVLLGGLLLFSVLHALAGLPAGIPMLGRLLGADVAYAASDLLSWLLLGLALPGTLRFLSTRYPSFVGFEMVTVGAILASPFAAHREGFINRPYFLVDPLWSRGYDPVPVLLGLGAISAGVLVVLTIGRSNRRSTLLDMTLMLLIIGALFLLTPERLLRDLIPEPKGGGAGLNQEKKDGGRGKNSGKDKGGKGDQDKMDNNQGDGSESPVAVVVLHDDYDPPYGYYYFRSGAFSQFNGKRLIADTTGRFDHDLVDHFPTEPTRIASEPHNPYHFKSLKSTVAMIQTHAKPFGLVDAVSVTPAENPNPRQFVRAYNVESQVLTLELRSMLGTAMGGRDWTQDQWKHYTDMPADPRYKKLADQIVSRLDPAYQKNSVAQAIAVKLYLDKTVTYTFTHAEHDNAPDPVADYIFDNPRGYCVHQAHAAVYLWRALGLPARVGVGYATDARNRAGGSTVLLRDRESHAWPEVYLQDLGWVILDISPEKFDVPQTAPPDPGLQRMLGEMARDNESKDKKEQEKFKKRSVQEVLREKVIELGKLGLFGLFLALATLYGIKIFRRLEPHLGTPERRGQASYRAALDALSDLGLRRKYGQGRQEFAREVGAEYPSLSGLTDLHLGHSMGRTPADPQRSIELLRGVQGEIGRTHPAWKRVLGLLNPFSWLRVK